MASRPTAPPPTTWTAPLADPREASLAEALFVLRNGRCSGTAAAQAEVQARFRERVRRRSRGRLAPDAQRLVAYCSASCTFPTIFAPGSTSVLSPSSFHFEGQTSFVFFAM